MIKNRLIEEFLEFCMKKYISCKDIEKNELSRILCIKGLRWHMHNI